MTDRDLTPTSEAVVSEFHERMHGDDCECDAVSIRDPLRRIEAAAAREALPSVEEMAAALPVAFRQPWDPRRPDWQGLATAILAALRAARASDGGR